MGLGRRKLACHPTTRSPVPLPSSMCTHHILLHGRSEPVRSWRHRRDLPGPRSPTAPAPPRSPPTYARPWPGADTALCLPAHLDRLADSLRNAGHDPVVLRGGMGAKARAAAPARLDYQPGQPPLLAIATGSCIGGFDGPALDALFLAAPISFKGRLVQYAARILRAFPGKPPPKSTITTTPPPACSPHPSPNAPPDTPASDSPTPAASPTHPVRAQPGKSLTRPPDR
jgi:hypothetical protein